MSGGGDAPIRAATLAELGALLELERAFPSDRIGAASYRRLLRRPSAEVWVVDDDGRVGGALVLLFRAGAAIARVYSVAVAERLRRRGVGGRLYAHAAERARARGCRALRLEVRVDNPAGQALAARAGFTADGVIPGFYEDGADALRMRLVLER